MADALISAILQQLIVVIDEEVQQEFNLLFRIKKDIKKLTNSLQTIKAALIDAEKRQVSEEAVRLWLNKLNNVAYDMDDVLDEWNSAILKSQIERFNEFSISEKKKKKKVSNLFFPFRCLWFRQIVFRRGIAIQIKEINEDLDADVREKDLFNFNVSMSREEPNQLSSTSFVDESETWGRNEAKNDLISKLCESSGEQKGLHVISIVGMGGIGKTTLAKLAYNDSEVLSNFEERIWVCVSETFNELRIAKAIFEALKGSSPNLVELESVLQHIREYITGRKVLLVLDDVWTDDYNRWEPLYDCLKHGLHGSKLLDRLVKFHAKKELRDKLVFALYVNLLSVTANMVAKHVPLELSKT